MTINKTKNTGNTYNCALFMTLAKTAAPDCSRKNILLLPVTSNLSKKDSYQMREEFLWEKDLSFSDFVINQTFKTFLTYFHLFNNSVLDKILTQCGKLKFSNFDSSRG